MTESNNSDAGSSDTGSSDTDLSDTDMGDTGSSDADSSPSESADLRQVESDSSDVTERSARPRIPPVLGLALRFMASLAVIALILNVLVRPFHVPSESMEPTLMTGDRVVAQIVGVDGHDLARGDIVAFGHGRTWQEERLPSDGSPLVEVARTAGDILKFGPSHTSHTVKRVIATGGQTVTCCDEQGRVMVDGEPLDEPYIEYNLPFDPESQACDSTTPSPRCFPSIAVPEGAYLVLGDNRSNSADSVIACRGLPAGAACAAQFVTAEQVVGLVKWRVWPLPPGGID